MGLYIVSFVVNYLLTQSCLLFKEPNSRKVFRCVPSAVTHSDVTLGLCISVPCVTVLDAATGNDREA